MPDRILSAVWCCSVGPMKKDNAISANIYHAGESKWFSNSQLQLHTIIVVQQLVQLVRTELPQALKSHIWITNDARSILIAIDRPGCNDGKRIIRGGNPRRLDLSP